MNFRFEEESERPAQIKVIGIGGGGCNAVSRMATSDFGGVDFVVINTDAQALKASPVSSKLQIGEKLTKGLGAGSDPEIGRKAAIEDTDKILSLLEGCDMVFITAGLGGGTGTGASPIVANLAKEMGILTVAVVTKPFQFEGKVRARQAEDGLMELKAAVDTLITIPNQRLLNVVERQTSFLDAFRIADSVLQQAVQGISDLVVIPGLINLDFADVRTIMAEKGMALMGTGSASGENRAAEAANRAITSPLLEDVSIEGAKGILINITGSSNLTLYEVNEASSAVFQAAHPDAHVIFGAVVDEKMANEMKVTVIATGFDAVGKAKMDETSKAIDFRALAGKNLDRPTYLRRKGNKPPEGRADQLAFRAFDEEDLEIPAFLRRQAD
ncbi:MAG: cell division protein FtsZ [candidate division NC10 bacterium]|nr:cell division protein FtsZ [candidate division NC10 bacterium]